VSLAVPAPSLARLRGKALDIRVSLRPETERDASLLRGFETRMMADLASRVETALGIGMAGRNAATSAADPWALGASAICGIVAEADGAEAVRLAVPLEHVVAFRKAGLAPPRRRRASARREDALRPGKVGVEARLGSAELNIGELRSLAPGDVLVLDRGLDEPTELLIADGGQPFARGRLDGAERITLILES
jgi:flagellar motor switch/type III secretory pathway protein FliN